MIQKTAEWVRKSLLLVLVGFVLGSAQESEPLRTEWRSPDGSQPMTFGQWKAQWESENHLPGGSVIYRSWDPASLPADSFVFGLDYAYFKDFVRHANGNLCQIAPPAASFIVYLNGNPDLILSDEAPRWSHGDPNISGMGWFGIELGNFIDPAISIGDTFSIVFTCYPDNEMPEQGSYDKQIIMLPMVAWPTNLYLNASPIPAPPSNLTLVREGAVNHLGWRQEPGMSYTIYRRNQTDTLALNFPRFMYHKLAENIVDSSYADAAIDTMDTYGYIIFTEDLSSGLTSGRSREIREMEAPGNVRAIIVQPELLSQIQSSLNQLVADWEDDNAAVIVYAMQFSTASALRDTLRQIEGLRGALLIGNFPVPWFQVCNDLGDDYQEFPVDLYFMDLDGVWEDNLYKPATGPMLPGSDGIFDTHYANYPRTSEKPEIVIGRITLTPGMGDAAEIINNYLSRCHLYRQDAPGIRQPFRALAYPDDDWNTWGNDIATLYMSQVYREYISIYDVNATTATDYRDRLNDQYSLIHVYVHSWSGGHAFKVNNGLNNQYFYNHQIVPAGANANFYHLFACGNSRYVEDLNCAGIYAFLTPTGINTIGTTHSGGMLEFDYFYSVLAEGISFGEAFFKTYQHGGQTGFSASMRGWSYGLTFNGDPFIVPRPPSVTNITPRPDPILSESFELGSYPNPFNSLTNITYQIPYRGWAEVAVHNSLGQEIRLLQRQMVNRGAYHLSWDGKDQLGKPVSSGIYLITLHLDDRLIKTHKILFLK